MTQLVCNNVRLDLYDDVSLQFVHENPLFAFDKLSCERTTQFKLPSTPVNDSVLALARIPAYKGVGMRRKFDCMLQDGVCVSRGYLYISAYDGTDYNAVFVTGELIDLQAIKNLGKIADIITFTETETIGGTPVSPLAAAGDIWRNVAYKKPLGQIVRPSIDLGLLYDAICQRYNLRAESLPAGAAGVRIIPNKVNGANEPMPFKCTIIDDPAQPSAQEPTTNYNSLEYDGTLFEYEDTIYEVTILSVTQYYNIRQYKCKTNLSLVMPDNWANTAYIVDLSQDGLTEGAFYGNRYFTKAVNQPVVAHGDPLRGRTIEFAAGDCFSFVDSRYFVNESQNIMGQVIRDSGFVMAQDPTFNTDYSIVVKTEPQNGDIARLQDNLPDMTFTELLKVIAAISGRVLNYDDENGLTFEQLNVATYQQKALGKLTERGEVQRTFADYAQNNIVRFDDETADRLIVDYTIDNDNIAYEQDLQVLPFSEGMRDGDYIFIPSEGEHPYLSINNGGAYLGRVALPQNAGLQTLCTASTQFKPSARMSMYEYIKLAAKTLLLIDGSLYVWTKKEWSKDVVKLTLARI